MIYRANRLWHRPWFVRLISAVALAWTVSSAAAWSFAGEPDAKPSQAAKDAAAKPAAAKPPVQPGLDDALLKDLDNELLEGAGDLKKAPKGKPPGANDNGETKPSAHPGDDGEDVGSAGEDRDPLVQISQRMRSLEELIPAASEQPRTQQVQQRVLDDLARLIEQAEKQQSSGKSSSSGKKQQPSAKRQSVQQPKSAAGKKSNQPAKDSTDQQGKAEPAKPDPELQKSMMKDSWGHLPQHAREQMLQSSPERFLPQYELMIERYYQRLAEEQKPR